MGEPSLSTRPQGEAMSVFRFVVKSLLLCGVVAAGVVALDQYQGRRYEVAGTDRGRFTLVIWKYWGLVQERHQAQYNSGSNTWELEKDGQRMPFNWKI